MTANEIRNLQLPYRQGVHTSIWEGPAFWLSEIAAQLAGLKELVSSEIHWPTGNTNTEPAGTTEDELK